MRSEIIDLVHMFLNKAEAKGFRCGDFPSITFNLKGAAAGRAILSGYDNEVQFNLPLLSRVSEEELTNTVGHEVAHIVANRHYNKSCGHGREWRYVMYCFGLKANRCHNYDTSGLVRRQKRLDIACACGVQFSLSQTMVNKIRKGEIKVCKKCKTQVKV